VALARDEPASFPGAATAVTAVLTEELGLGPSLGSGVVADGSGLSRTNRLSAQLLADLLAVAAQPAEPADPADPEQAAQPARPELAGVFTGLPVAGWSGTLATRHETPPPQVAPGVGVVRAKTGSLNGVDALAGVVVTGSGRLLAFAVLANDVPIGRPASWVALDRIPAALATL
jgi:D-alanyl-D-alanine carboxypeptidase/D-alanyl-D-alanine-endopeptidase (penicillin-binding protein 4)